MNQIKTGIFTTKPTTTNSEITHTSPSGIPQSWYAGTAKNFLSVLPWTEVNSLLV
jgi:hypothetical protein